VVLEQVGGAQAGAMTAFSSYYGGASGAGTGPGAGAYDYDYVPMGHGHVSVNAAPAVTVPLGVGMPGSTDALVNMNMNVNAGPAKYQHPHPPHGYTQQSPISVTEGGYWERITGVHCQIQPPEVLNKRMSEAMVVTGALPFAAVPVRARVATHTSGVYHGYVGMHVMMMHT
jgi:hypothetical protein